MKNTVLRFNDLLYRACIGIAGLSVLSIVLGLDMLLGAFAAGVLSRVLLAGSAPADRENTLLMDLKDGRVVIELRPEVELTSYEPVAIEMPFAEATDAEIDEQVEAMAEHYTDYEDASAATKMKPENYADLTMKATDADGNAVVLSNKKAVFSVTLNYISEEILPELTDAWVEEHFGTSDDVHTVEDLRAEFRQMLYQNNLNTAVMDYLLANSTFKDELPKEITDYQVNQCLNYYYTMANYYGYDLDSFVQTAAGYENADDLLEGMSDSITTYSKEALLYQAVAETLDIVPTQEQIDTYSSYTGTYGENYCTMVALMDAVTDALTESAVVS